MTARKTAPPWTACEQRASCARPSAPKPLWQNRTTLHQEGPWTGPAPRHRESTTRTMPGGPHTSLGQLLVFTGEGQAAKSSPDWSSGGAPCPRPGAPQLRSPSLPGPAALTASAEAQEPGRPCLRHPHRDGPLPLVGRWLPGRCHRGQATALLVERPLNSTDVMPFVPRDWSKLYGDSWGWAW